jgi:spore coat protein CotH
LRYSDDTTFVNEIESWINLNSVVDWHLLLLFTNNGDGLLKNFFLYKQSVETPFSIALWDYDHAFGRDGDNELNMRMDAVDANRNVMLRRLMKLNVQEYNSKLSARYFALRGKIFTAENISEMMEENKKSIEPYIEQNFAKWPVTSEFYKDSSDFYFELNLMQEYVEKKMKYLDEYFSK